MPSNMLQRLPFSLSFSFALPSLPVSAVPMTVIHRVAEGERERKRKKKRGRGRVRGRESQEERGRQGELEREREED